MLQGEQLSAKCAELKNIRLSRKEKLKSFSVINITKFPTRRLKPMCNHGHALSGDNLLFSASGVIRCRACHNERSRRVRKKLSENRAINKVVEINHEIEPIVIPQIDNHESESNTSPQIEKIAEQIVSPVDAYLMIRRDLYMSCTIKKTSISIDVSHAEWLKMNGLKRKL